MMRCVRFLGFLGLVFVLLSFISPMVAPTYNPYVNLAPGDFRGVMVNCDTVLAVQIISENEIPFTVYILDYENGVRALQEGSLENVTVIDSYSNRTELIKRIPILEPGWYSVLVTPYTNESLSFFEVTIERPIPSPAMLLTGVSVLSLSLISYIVVVRYINE